MNRKPSPSHWRWQLKKTIPSSSDDGHGVIEELNQALANHQWEGRDAFHIHMAIEEAIVNAIEHGNKRDPKKFVHIHFCLSDHEVRLEISDEGDGFILEDLRDPTDDENLERPRGRGVMLIRELMSEVHYNDRGNSIMMVKHRSPPLEPSDDE